MSGRRIPLASITRVRQSRRVLDAPPAARPATASGRLTASLLAALAGGGWLIGAACGGGTKTPALPAAGDRLDDGSGVLARGWREALRDDDLVAKRDIEEPMASFDEDDAFYDYDELVPLSELVGVGAAGLESSVYGGYLIDFGQDDDSNAPPSFSYQGQTVSDGGAIAGKVSFANRGPTSGKPECDHRGAAPRGAVVYLQSISRGKRNLVSAGYLDAQAGGAIMMSRCGPAPLLQLMSPVGGALRLHNDTADTKTFVVEHVGGDPASDAVGGRDEPRRGRTAAPPRPPVDAAAVRAQRYALASRALGSYAIDRGGIYRVSVEGEPPAYLVAQAHPYFALTDPAGSFQLTEVPPGEYVLVIFSPPGAAAPADPVGLQRKRVRVQAGKTTTVSISVR